MEKIGREIICTLGPASMSESVVLRLEEMGISLFRINLSHTNLDDLPGQIRFVQQYSRVPLCLDTEGAQVRTGMMDGGAIHLEEQQIVRVQADAVLGDRRVFCFTPPQIIDELETGDVVSIDFNSVLAQVVRKEPGYAVLNILTGGAVGSNKAVSLTRDLMLPPLTPKDREAIRIGLEMGVSHVALSFANRASDVDEVRSETGGRMTVISKIESIDGVINLDEIASRSDAILIDRGDLSRQVPIEKIPAAQKSIIRRAKEAGARVYVATNLLESMIDAPVPTRAEVNDIFNTLCDGADGLVLAAETAVGAYPVPCVRMISKIIRQHAVFMERGFQRESLRSRDTYLIAEAHGGRLVNRAGRRYATDELAGMKTLVVDRCVLMDAEQIGLGTYSPIEGFMGRADVESVLGEFKLTSGIIWPLPIVLQQPWQAVKRIGVGDAVVLRVSPKAEAMAVLHIEEKYRMNLDAMAVRMFGVADETHPGVRQLFQRGEWFLGGKVDVLRRLPADHKHFELTPSDTRFIFENKGWSKVVGFHTRNVIHRAHEELQLRALDEHRCDGIFIHPVVGQKKHGDFSSRIILNSYELMMRKYYPKGRVLLGAFQTYSRYAGPREAVFTALCRKNFGCSHFIVGRDHTGVGKFYPPDASQKLFEDLGDLGVVPIIFGELYYCRDCNAHVDRCQHGRSAAINISGSECRAMLKSKQQPPGWFMREEVSQLVLEDVHQGEDVFIA